MKKLKLIFMSLFILSACNGGNSSIMNSSLSNSSSSILESSTVSSSSTSSSISSSSIEEVKEYKKDSEGFFILEDDYFKNNSKEDGKETSKVRFNETIDEDARYDQMRMFIGDKQVPLYNCKTNMSQTWSGEAPSRMNNAVGIIELEGKVEIKLQTNFAFLDEHVIRPLSANVNYKVDNNRRVITFTITSPGQYTVELRSNRTLHLFVNEYKQYEEYKKNNAGGCCGGNNEPYCIGW